MSCFGGVVISAARGWRDSVDMGERSFWRLYGLQSHFGEGKVYGCLEFDCGIGFGIQSFLSLGQTQSCWDVGLLPREGERDL